MFQFDTKQKQIKLFTSMIWRLSCFHNCGALHGLSICFPLLLRTASLKMHLDSLQLNRHSYLQINVRFLVWRKIIRSVQFERCFLHTASPQIWTPASPIAVQPGYHGIIFRNVCWKKRVSDRKVALARNEPNEFAKRFSLLSSSNHGTVIVSANTTFLLM